jgi:hypothetical protein
MAKKQTATPASAREHVVSAILTFAAVFLPSMLSQLLDAPIWTLAEFRSDAALAAFASAILTATRFALKATLTVPITKAVSKVV